MGLVMGFSVSVSSKAVFLGMRSRVVLSSSHHPLRKAKHGAPSTVACVVSL